MVKFGRLVLWQRGGASGNAIFFLVSGFCLSKTSVPIGKWLGKRWIRIYPQTWLITIIAIVIGSFKVSEITDIFKLFIFPTGFWFIGAIVIFYVLAYFVDKYIDVRFFKFLYLGELITYVLYYVFLLDTSTYSIENDFPFKCIFYFVFILIGIHLRKTLGTKKTAYKGGKVGLVFCSISALICFYLTKILLSRYEWLIRLQGIEHVFLIIFAVTLFCGLYSFENYFKEKQNNIMGRSVRYISKITLEIYLVQVPIIGYAKYVSFPWSLILFSLVIFIGAGLLHEVFERIFRRGELKR